MNTGLKVVAGFIAGTAAGALIGLLFAPNSGRKTRKMIAREARELETELEHAAKKKIRQARDVANDKWDELTNSGKEMVGELKRD